MILPLLCLLLSPAVSQDAHDPLDYVPADALMFVTVGQLDALRADSRENAWYRMLQDSAFDPTWGMLRETEGWKAMFEEGNSEVDPLELLASIHGSVTLFVLGEKIDDRSEGTGGIIVDPGADRAEFERMLDALIAAKDQHRVLSYETYEGIELILMEDDESNPLTRQGPTLFMETEELYFGFFGDDAAEVSTLARATVDRLQGATDSPGLAASPLLAEARGGEASPGRIEMFVNTHAFVNIMPEESLESFDEEAQPVLEALGLPQMTWVHGWMDLAAGERSDFELSLRLPDEGYLRDWAGFALPAPQHLAGLMPQDSSTIALVGFDVWGMYQSFWDMLEELFPDEYEEARLQIEGMGQSIGGVDLEQDFLAQLTGDTASFSAPVPEAEWIAAQQQVVEFAPGEVPEDLLFGEAMLVGLVDAELVALTVEDLLGFAGLMGLFDPMEIDSEDFQGTEIQSLELPTGGVASWCFDDGLFAFSMYPSVLRSVLSLRGSEGSPTALADPALARFFSAEADASYLGLADSNTAVRMGLETLGMLQSMFPDFGGDEWGDMGFDNDAEVDDFGWEFGDIPIPGPEVVDEYLRGTIIATMRVEGSVMKLRYSTR